MCMATKRYESVPMPRKYLVEMGLDRRAACMVYRGRNYAPGAELEYLENSREKALLHPELLKQLRFLLTMLRDDGEDAAFHYMKRHVLAGKPWPWEE